MAPQDNQLPEGTDHIINGAMETGGGSGAGSKAPSGFVASGGDDGNSGAGLIDTLRSQGETIRDRAGDRVRELADGGKSRASDALDDLSKGVADAAGSIEERLGGDYAEYARKAGDAISEFADTLRRKEVDELYDDVRAAVSKSPAVAIGIAAAVGFTLIRLVKAGLPDNDGDAKGGRGTDA